MSETLEPRLQPELRLESSTRNADETVQAGAGAGAVAAGSIERPGTVVGRYKLLRTLGRGGMGIVYRAEQQYPVRRQVALKIIKPGMDSEQAIVRFEAERQALALMDHPNIARVYDAGTTDAGRLYFVMELVEGVPITKYCDDRKSNLRARLKLFTEVCQAIQHAHQKGIVHRDIKPSNVLVAVYDGRPAPKVIDFGVAKAVTESQRLCDSSMMTVAGAIVGTYEYMSPEQAQGGKDVDTRSDIYSLGVLLFELLTGTTPLDRSTIRDLPEAEILRRISEEDPPRPSVRVASDREKSHALRGDLDWIAVAALEKEPPRRYATANDLAADVERFLDGEPITARPPSTTYLMGKFARRYRKPLAAAAIFVVLLVAATVVSTLLAIRARRAETQARTDRDRAVAAERSAVAAGQAARLERDRAGEAEEQASAERDAAVAEKRRADTEAAIAAAVNRFLQDDVLAQASARRQVIGNNKPDPDLKVRAALDRAAARIAGQFDSQPQVEASIRTTIGNAYLDLGLDLPAGQQLKTAVDLDRRAYGAEHPNTLNAEALLGRVYAMQGKRAEAADLAQQVLDARRRTQGADHPDTILALSDFAVIQGSLGRSAEAEKLAQQALQTSERRLGAEHAVTLQARSNLGTIYLAQISLPSADAMAKKFQQAEAVFRSVLEVRRRRLGPDHPDTLDSMSALSTTYHRLHQFAEAAAQEREIVEIRRRILGVEDTSTLSSMANLAVDLNSQAKYEEAEKINLEILDVRKRVLGPEHPGTLETMINLADNLRNRKPEESARLDGEALAIRRRLSGPNAESTMGVMAGLAADYRRLGNLAEAERINSELVEMRRRINGDDHPMTRGAIGDLARVYRAEGRWTDAQKLDTLCLNNSIRLNGPDQGNTQRHRNELATDYLLEGRFDLAEPLARQAFDGLLRSNGRESAYVRESAVALAISLHGVGRDEEAERLIRENLTIDEKIEPDGWRVFLDQSLLGATLGATSAKREPPSAEDLLVRGYQGLVERKTKMDGHQRVFIPLAAAWLADYYTASGRVDKAAELRRTALAK
jgi:non-specific serine/threonine protein kinase/serine/threonine-protein kinase